MNVIVTCGPSYEPIDEVRRITNFSTGRLGITLSNYFADQGHRVICLKGEQATDPTPPRARELIPFSTNDDLLAKLQELPQVDVLFHAAALADFKVASVKNPAGEPILSKKFSTRGDGLILTLEPTIKVLPKLRDIFPQAKVVGWKYEVAGTREEALKKAFAQIAESKTNACVLNGSAYGPGFCFCEPDSQSPIENLEDLCAWLLNWSERR